MFNYTVLLRAMYLICVWYGQICVCNSWTDKILSEFEEKNLAVFKNAPLVSMEIW